MATRNGESKTLEKYDTLLGEKGKKDTLLKMGNGLTGAMVGVPDGMPIGLMAGMTPCMRPGLGGMMGSCWGWGPCMGIMGGIDLRLFWGELMPGEWGDGTMGGG